VCVIFPREAHYEESAVNRQSNDGSVPGDTAECCSVSEISMYVQLLYMCSSNPSRSLSIATALYLVQQHPVFSYSLLGSDALSAKLHGVTSKDRNLNTDHLEKLHTNTLDVTPAPTKSRNSIRISSSMVVLNSTNSTVGNFRLSNDFASKFCCSLCISAS